MNTKRSRVEPVFGWLRDHGGPDWPAQLLALCENLNLPPHANGKPTGRKSLRGKNDRAALLSPGAVASVEFAREREVKASPARLAWMIRNASRLAPGKGKRRRDYTKRVIDNPARDEALRLLDSGTRKGVPKKLILEGATHADCLIECQHLVIWIDGTRHDWLATSTKGDVSRDQLARGLEAAWLLAEEAGKECCWILCHESELKNHEAALIEGYRNGTWWAGLPHLQAEQRRALGQRIGTVTWRNIAAHWPELIDLSELADLDEAVISHMD